MAQVFSHDPGLSSLSMLMTWLLRMWAWSCDIWCPSMHKIQCGKIHGWRMCRSRGPWCKPLEHQQKGTKKRSQISRCTRQKYVNIMFKTKIWYKNRYCNTIWQLPLHRHNVERTIFISRGTAPGKPLSKWRHQSQDRLSAPEAKKL